MSSIITQSGRSLDVFRPSRAEIDLEDIAHALANSCRWGGHCRVFYSVAQHSVIVSDHVAPEHARFALLHDAAEAYLVDVPTPIKAELPQYVAAEARLLREIFARFGLHGECPAEVKTIDARLMATEAIELRLRPHLWASGVPASPLPIMIDPLSPTDAKALFLARFRALWRQHHER